MNQSSMPHSGTISSQSKEETSDDGRESASDGTGIDRKVCGTTA